MIESWTLRRSLQAAAVPAAGYALQNWLTQCAYANLDSLTFNLLNQTKTLFAALCLYLVMGKRQSRTQLVALSLLLGAALLLNAGNHDNGNSNSSSGGGLLVNSGDGVGTFERLWLGVLPVLCASFLSGLFGVVTQRTLQTGYNSFQLSLELAVYGAASVLLAYALGDASYSGGTQGLFQGWTPLTFVPVLSQAAGGVIVGQVISINTCCVLCTSRASLFERVCGFCERVCLGYNLIFASSYCRILHGLGCHRFKKTLCRLFQGSNFPVRSVKNVS